MSAMWGMWPRSPRALDLQRQAGRADRAAELEREAETEARLERAQSLSRAFYAVHAMTPGQYAMEQSSREAQRQARYEQERADQRRIAHDDAMSGYLAAGREPRTLEQVLRIAALAG